MSVRTRLIRLFGFWTVISLFGLLLLVGCKRTKDSFTNRTYHEMTSRFNPLFNGVEAYKAGKLKVEQGWKEDFANILPVYKWPDEETAKNITPDMDRAMEKAVKVITKHSMQFNNVEKNDYIDDSYFLLGQARFYKRETFSALETFNYILQEYDKDEIAYEARLWSARCRIQVGNPAGAKADLELLYNDQELPEDLKEEVLATMAQMNIDMKKWDDVAVNLGEAREEARKKEMRVRYAFIQGQALERAGKPYEASEVFRQVVKMRPSYDFYFHSQLNRARNFDVYAEDPQVVYNGLQKMVKDEKNIENRDQIYYVMAEVALKEEEYPKAEEYLQLSIRNSTVNPTQKGLSYLKLGEINFSFQSYEMAQAYYDSASTALPPEHPRYEAVNKRAEVLNRMVNDLRTIRLQDSLQKLAGMDAATQLAIAEQIVEDLIAREEAEREAEALRELNEELAENDAMLATGPSAGSGPNAGKWYFYNTNLMSKGRSEFKRQWGDRPNVDNWAQRGRMRNNIMSSNEGNAESDTAAADSEEQGEVSTDPYKPETYIARIPDSPEEFAASDQLIRDALIDLGLVYKDGLEDIPHSIDTYEDLLKRYTDFKEKPRVLYTLFLLYREQENMAEAERFRKMLLEDYAGTEFAILAANDGIPVAKDPDRPCLVKYEQAYREYEQKRFSSAENLCRQGLDECAEDVLHANYMLLRALCLGGKSQRSAMIEQLKACYADYPNTDAGAEAGDILRQLGEPTGDEVVQGDEEGEGTQAAEAESPYKRQPKQEHRYMMLVNGKVNINDMQIAFSDHNQEFHRFEKLNQQILPLNQETMTVLVTGFKNEAAALAYKNALMNDKRMVDAMAGKPYTEYVISKKNFMYFFRNKDLKGYEAFYKKNYKDK